jgi:hypothetical protein
MPGLSHADQRLARATRVKPTSEDQKLSGVLSNRSTALDLRRSEPWVRETTHVLPPLPVPSPVSSPPAHPSNRLIAQLNTNWRVIHDPLQWVLQRKKGNPRKRTQVGRTDPSAPQEKCCCGAFESIAARSTKTHWLTSRRCPTIMPMRSSQSEN